MTYELNDDIGEEVLKQAAPFIAKHCEIPQDLMSTTAAYLCVFLAALDCLKMVDEAAYEQTRYASLGVLSESLL